MTQSDKALVNAEIDALLQTVNLDDTQVSANIYICTIGWMKALSGFKIQDSRCLLFKTQNMCTEILQIIDYTTDKIIIVISQKHYKLDINTLTYSASLAKSSSLQLLNNENDLNTDTGFL